MLLSTMIEDIEAVFPKVGRTRIIFDINNVMRMFCERTRCLYSRLVLTTADKLTEDTDKLIWTYTIPDDFWEARSATCCAQEEIEVTGANEITFYYNSTPDDDIVVIYSRYPLTVAAMSDEPEIPEMYLPAIIAKVKEKYYADNGVLQNAAYERSIYEKGIAEALRFANTRPLRNLDSTPPGGGATGSPSSSRKLGRTSLIQGLNTVTIGATMADTAYNILWNDTGVQVAEYNPTETNPPATRTTTTFQVLAADVVSNFEFIVEHP